MGKKERTFQTGNIVTVSIAHLVHDIYASFLAPILPLIIDKLGISLVLAGLLDIFRKIPSLASPFIGLLADRICVRYFIIIAPTISAVSMSLLGLAPHYIVLAILIFMAGIGSTLFHVPSPVMIKRISGRKIGKGMSYYMLGGEIARTLGPLTILGAVSLWGFEGIYRLIPFGVLTSVVLYFKIHRIDIHKDFSKSGDISARRTIRKMVPFFISIGGFIFFRAGMKSALTIYLPTYLTFNGASLWLAGISLAILQLSGAAGTFLAGIISDRIGRKKALLIIAILNPILMMLFIYSDGILIIPVLIVTGFFLFASGPVLLALVHDHDTKHMSLVNGIYMTFSFVLSSVMVLLVGWFADRFGLVVSYKIMAVLSVGSVPSVLSLKTRNMVVSKVL